MEVMVKVNNTYDLQELAEFFCCSKSAIKGWRQNQRAPKYASKILEQHLEIERLTEENNKLREESKSFKRKVSDYFEIENEIKGEVHNGK